MIITKDEKNDSSSSSRYWKPVPNAHKDYFPDFKDGAYLPSTDFGDPVIFDSLGG